MIRIVVPVAFAMVVLAAPVEAADSGLPEYSRSYDMVTGDLNGDGLADIVMSRHQNRKLAPGDRDGIWLAEGDGSFTLAFELAQWQDRHGCAIGDFDGDDRGDVYCVLGAGHGTKDKQNETWIQSDGGWVDAAWPGGWDVTGRGRHVVSADFNGDGLDDLYVTNSARTDGARSENLVLLSTGSDWVEVVSGATGTHGHLCVATADFKLEAIDHGPDLVTCSGRVFANAGAGTFKDVTRRWLAPSDRVWAGAAVVDWNADGKLDLVTVDRKGRVYLRLFARRTHWSDPELLAATSMVGKDIRAGSAGVYVVLQGPGCIDPGMTVYDAPDLFITPTGSVQAPAAWAGCGDRAAAIDGGFVILNGDADTRGNVQIWMP
jgi:hypothetical protein